MEEITICIVTFKKRLKLVQSLIDKIKNFYPDIQVLVAINGENEEGMDEDYRKKILTYIASKNNVIPLMSPEHRCLAKLFNTMLTFSRTSYNLVLNDDILFDNPNVIEMVQEVIEKTKLGLFFLNGNFSHFVICKELLHDLGYFDERFLAHGEEDGDFLWRYMNKYGEPINSLYVDGLSNIGDYSEPTTNMKCHMTNKPLWNRMLINEMYKSDESATVQGWFGEKKIKVWEDVQQYPYEMFWMKNKKYLKEGIKVDLDNE